MVQPRLEIYYPSGDLSPFVKKYYLFEAENDGLAHHIPAWTKPIMVFQCGGKVNTTITGKPEVVRKASFSGLVDSPYQFESNASEFRIFIAEFTDFGMYALFKEDNSQFINCTEDAFGIIPPDKRSEITEALSEVFDMSAKVKIIETFLRKLKPDEKQLYKIRTTKNALKLVRSTKGSISVKELSGHLGYSERYINRQFKLITGLSPKKFSSIVRFTNHFNHYYDYPENEHGYLDQFYDQSHFIRNFSQYTGFSPGKLPKENFFFARILNGL